MTEEKTTVDPVKVYSAIADIMSRRENLKITVNIRERGNCSKNKTA